MRGPLPILPILLTVFTVVRTAAFQFPDRPPEMSSSGILLELEKLSVLGSVLYIGAHPDDENTNLLAWLTKGRMMRAGYLSLTRGEGGQNLLGAEKGDALGLIRTEELLAARRVDGADQYFTRAIDFGYSKNSGEAIRLWGGDEIVADIVRVIRAFQPDLIITRFSPEIGGHGQHTASAILTRRAYDLAADPSYRPEEVRDLPPWRAKRLLFNGSSFMLSQLDTSRGIRINSGGYNPLLGLSYNEISGIGRSMHKSQGFGAAQTRGDVINYFFHTAGDSAVTDIFEGIGISWSRVPGGADVAGTLAEAVKAFDPMKPSAIVPLLARALSEMERLPPSVWIREKRKDILRLIRMATGIWIDALVSDPSAAPGDTVTIRASVINRSELPVTLERVSVPFTTGERSIGSPCPYNQTQTIGFSAVVPPDEPAWTPYWLEMPSTGFRYDVADRSLIGLPRSPPRHVARFRLDIAGAPVSFDVPLEYLRVDPIEGEVRQPFTVVPPVSVEPVERVILCGDGAPKTLDVRVAAGRAGVRGSVRVETPPGWKVVPDFIPFEFRGREQTSRAQFTISRSGDAAPGEYRVVADAEGREFSAGTVTIRYPHIPAQAFFPGATGRLLTDDIRRNKSTIGYIAGSGDDVPEALGQIGYDVRSLSDADLLSADLSGFESIVAGVRAYNTRPVLGTARRRLMEYIAHGGTYIVQYVTNRESVADSIGPYPFHVSRVRVSEEDAPVTLLTPDHPALASPNRISQDDFTGWVQERGLYFADSWDSAYTTILSSHDRDEPARQGGVLIARYGEGYFCYTGLSFFRQLPAGVAGAYRLFANLVELGGGGKK